MTSIKNVHKFGLGFMMFVFNSLNIKIDKNFYSPRHGIINF